MQHTQSHPPLPCVCICVHMGVPAPTCTQTDMCTHTHTSPHRWWPSLPPSHPFSLSPCGPLQARGNPVLPHSGVSASHGLVPALNIWNSPGFLRDCPSPHLSSPARIEPLFSEAPPRPPPQGLGPKCLVCKGSCLLRQADVCLLCS